MTTYDNAGVRAARAARSGARKNLSSDVSLTC